MNKQIIIIQLTYVLNHYRIFEKNNLIQSQESDNKEDNRFIYLTTLLSFDKQKYFL